MFALPYDYYKACLFAGEIREDTAQEAVVKALDQLARTIKSVTRSAWLPWDAGKGLRGLYIYGTVGRGKTMLMDLFFQSVPLACKRRTHFHAFMAEVHERLHEYRQKKAGGDALKHLAHDIAKESRLICFDEFQVYNIADAMILGRLFRFLFKQGVAIVATSNTAPDDLYKDGLQRDLFLPAIALFKKRLQVMEIGDGHDYRQARLKGLPVYLTPHDNQAYMTLQKIFNELTDSAQVPPYMLDLNGRPLLISRSARNVAWFSFAELCQQPLAAIDYLKLTQYFHTIILENVPQLADERRDEALRFIYLIDVLYEKHCVLVMSAAKPADALLAMPSSLAGQFARTASRLAEMQSLDYLLAPHADKSVPVHMDAMARNP